MSRITWFQVGVYCSGCLLSLYEILGSVSTLTTWGSRGPEILRSGLGARGPEPL